MTAREHHLLSVIPVAFLAVAVGYHPAVAVPLVVGVFLPELDTFNEKTHRSWLLHTLLLPAFVYLVLSQMNGFAAVPWALDALNFIALGMALHLFADYVYPRRQTHTGAVWPVRPVGRSAHWGLLWMGVAWTVQWFVYLVPEFIPWLVGA
ncbi:hypothetical protein SAMN04487950_3321 [Halogranum rubrum]|uniref:Uncharacterized protein n=1 Tax=Halogranum rubrum TaxID=553466 RepID=A0A1I4GPE6_9EURY|nr:hypothetical protein [Halogranum rubrum]SFL31908.1 hypothetical protein SAMN04487950_3321 [Halogranum rubrum]